MPTPRMSASVKETVERFTIYEADIKDEDTDKGKRIFYVLGTRLVIERGNDTQVYKRKGKVSTIAWRTKQNLFAREVSKAKKQEADEQLTTARVTVAREHPGTFRKHKTRPLPVILTASEQGESSEYDPSFDGGGMSSNPITSEDSTPKIGRRSSADLRAEEKMKSKHPKRKETSRSSSSSSSSFSISESSATEIDVENPAGLGDCSLEETQPLAHKKHVSVEWTEDQKKILYSSFARKSHDYSVYISPDEALKRAKELNVYDPNDPKRIYVSCPVFKVVAVPTQMMGKEGFMIKAIKKIYFQDRAGHVQAGMMDVIYHDKSNTEPNDFVFDATQIRDNIVPPVKISQDLKIPMIIGAITTLLQILQVVVSYYLTSGITTNSSK